MVSEAPFSRRIFFPTSSISFTIGESTIYHIQRGILDDLRDLQSFMCCFGITRKWRDAQGRIS